MKLSGRQTESKASDSCVRCDDVDEQVRRCLNDGHIDDAFERVLECFGDKILRLARSILVDHAAAEDAAQQALVRIWRGLRGFRHEASVSTWVYAVARNTCLTAIKRRPPAMLSLDEPDVRRAVEHLPADESGSSRLPDVDLWVRQLPEPYRQVLLLFYMQSRSYEDVSTLLQLPLGTVKTRLRRARKLLLQIAAQHSHR